MDRLFTCHHVVHICVQNNETAIFTKTKFSRDWTRFSCLNFPSIQDISYIAADKVKENDLYRLKFGLLF